MSHFAVDVRVIESVRPHPNADRLELASVEGLGYQMVVGKGEFNQGSKAIYIPLDAVLPDALRDSLKLQRNRIKTVKLRGEISQGLLVPLSAIPVGTDIAVALGISKHDPDEHVGMGGGSTMTLPAGLTMYDIENAERFQSDFQEILSGEYVVTEKLEGTNFCAVLDEDEVFHVCSRRHSLEESDSVWWHVAQKYNLRDTLSAIRAGMDGATHLALYGEVIGPRIQQNYYNLPEVELRVFDLKVNHRWASWSSLCEIQRRHFDHIQLVPEAIFNEDRSILAPNKLREGVVVRRRDDSPFGACRLLKLKSKEYLLNEDAA